MAGAAIQRAPISAAEQTEQEPWRMAFITGVATNTERFWE
jgi:hypothetical protein